MGISLHVVIQIIAKLLIFWENTITFSGPAMPCFSVEQIRKNPQSNRKLQFDGKFNLVTDRELSQI